MVKRCLGTLLFLLAVTALTAGCKGGGGPSASFSPPITTSFVTPPGDSGGDGESVALVHNPEPASMLLWGVGLAGAALARRRNKSA